MPDDVEARPMFAWWQTALAVVFSLYAYDLLSGVLGKVGIFFALKIAPVLGMITGANRFEARYPSPVDDMWQIFVVTLLVCALSAILALLASGFIFRRSNGSLVCLIFAVMAITGGIARAFNIYIEGGGVLTCIAGFLVHAAAGGAALWLRIEDT